MVEFEGPEDLLRAWKCERCNSLHVGDFGGVCQHCGTERGDT
jgi:hypothetical protein